MSRADGDIVDAIAVDVANAAHGCGEVPIDCAVEPEAVGTVQREKVELAARSDIGSAEDDVRIANAR